MTVPNSLQIGRQTTGTGGGDEQIAPVLEVQRLQIAAPFALGVGDQKLFGGGFGDLRLSQPETHAAEQSRMVGDVAGPQLLKGAGAGKIGDGGCEGGGIEIPQFLLALLLQEDLGTKLVVGGAAEDEMGVGGVRDL